MLTKRLARYAQQFWQKSEASMAAKRSAASFLDFVVSWSPVEVDQVDWQ
jgi:hypothetical protein